MLLWSSNVCVHVCLPPFYIKEEKLWRDTAIQPEEAVECNERQDICYQCGNYSGQLYGEHLLPTTSVIAAVYAYLLTKFKDKALPWNVMKEVLLKSIVNTAVVLFVMQTAAGFSWVLTNARVPHMLGELSASLGDSRVVFLILVNVLLLITGCLITGSGAVSILAPILLPVAVSYGIDPIFLGALMIVNLAIGYITPPVGVDLYIAGSIGKVSIEEFIKMSCHI